MDRPIPNDGINNKKKDYTDKEIAEFADWSEAQELSTTNPDWKKAFGAVRQGCDWILRRRINVRENG